MTATLTPTGTSLAAGQVADWADTRAAAATRTVTVITDCVEWAWWISGKRCLGALDPSTVAVHGAALHTAAVAMLAPELVRQWRRRGYRVVFVPAAVFAPGPELDALYAAVAEAAVAAIPPGLLLGAAGITPGIGR